MGMHDRKHDLPGAGLDHEGFNDLVHSFISVVGAHMKKGAKKTARAHLEAWAESLERNDRAPNVIPLRGPRPGPEEQRHIADRLARAATIRSLLERSL